LAADPSTYRIGNCQSGTWQYQFIKTKYRIVQGGTGNIGGDASFSGCNEDEVVVGGGGFCSPLKSGAASTAISTTPMKKGDSFPSWGSAAGVAPNNGWYYDCDGHPAIGGIATAVVTCLQL